MLVAGGDAASLCVAVGDATITVAAAATTTTASITTASSAAATGPGKVKSTKDIQSEIQAVLRQITASVTFLPILQEPCTFDLLVYVCFGACMHACTHSCMDACLGDDDDGDGDWRCRRHVRRATPPCALR